MALLRAVSVLVGLAAIWSISASQVPSQVKLDLFGVVPGATVSQPFGCTTLELEPPAYWCPFHHFHSGVDLAAPQGTGVYSATAGRVGAVGYDAGGPGIYVVVQDGGAVRILYCHLASAMVRPGAELEPGQLVGTVGATGLATGPHLHLEIQVDRVPVDPAGWLAS